MADCFERICKLAGMLGFDETPNSHSLAELRGYAAGIDCIMEDCVNSEKAISPATAFGHTLDLYCNMFSVSGELSEDEKRALILERFAEKYGVYCVERLEEALESLGASCTISNGDVTISLENATVDFMSSLSDIIDNYVSPTSQIYISGDNYDYDRWDSFDYTFNSYDGFNLPFYILDQF